MVPVCVRSYTSSAPEKESTLRPYWFKISAVNKPFCETIIRRNAHIHQVTTASILYQNDLVVDAGTVFFAAEEFIEIQDIIKNPHTYNCKDFCIQINQWASRH